MSLDDLPADAALRTHAIAPAADLVAAQHIMDACDKLLRQFINEGALAGAAVEVQQAGRFLVMAWQEGAGEGLSGCRKDKLAKLLTKLEGDHGCQILDTPPLVVETPSGIVCAHRADLRPLVAAGKVTQDSAMWDLRCETLGAWRDEARKPIRDSWMAPIVARMWQGTNS